MLKNFGKKMDKMVMPNNLMNNVSMNRSNYKQKAMGNANDVRSYVVETLKSMPEVKDAKGTMNVKFEDGRTVKVNFSMKK